MKDINKKVWKARAAKRYLPLFLGLKELTEAGGDRLPRSLPPEVRWERIREASPSELPARTVEALRVLDKANPSLFFLFLSGKLLDTPQEDLEKASRLGMSKEETGEVLACLVGAVERGGVKPPQPFPPSPVVQLMVKLLPPQTGAVQNLEARGVELLLEAHRHLVRFGHEVPKLYLTQNDPFNAFYLWVRLASLGLEAATSTGTVVPTEGFDGILAHPAQVDWEWVKDALGTLRAEGRMVLLVEEEARGTDAIATRGWLVNWRYILGAIRLNPRRHGLCGVVLLLGNPEDPIGDTTADLDGVENPCGKAKEIAKRLIPEIDFGHKILIANLDMVENPSDWVEEQVIHAIRNGKSHPGLVEKAS